jgi:hypothetical protein
MNILFGSQIFIFNIVWITLLIVKNSLGQYEISLQALEVLVPNEKTFLNLDKIKVKRFGRNQPHVGDGEIELFRDVGDDFDVVSNLYKKQGQEYRLTPFNLKGKICEALKSEDNPFTEQLWKYTDFPPKETCPFPTGVYHINKLYVGNMTDLPPVMDSGDYMVKVQFFDENKSFLQGFELFATIYNKVMYSGK